MGIFSLLFGCGHRCSDGSYRSADDYARNRENQLAMTPQTLSQLRDRGVTEETLLKLEYFFYTNDTNKASALARELEESGYDGGYDTSASNKKEFVITGWTKKMKMDEHTVVEWVFSMCEIGKRHDCEFDGWGTNPQQNEEADQADTARP